ncbi:pyridoxamine 5'-phosphate oxidase family protein [Cumulibacter soli]|uniref:pyridoxamine 5'-phosphate oxidase family protein n=1 Tax=Cumulibacter soli TaxID=2546344 RepID=UPI0010683384|nr:pyridoxamine 5'-phosphate oxidase family protein [Cumulibacter soli]
MSEPPVSVITEEECWDLLSSRPIGRVAMIIGDEVEVFPVSYELREGSMYIRTAEGTKLFGIALGRPVAFEIDDWDDKSGWSVIAKCSARQLDREFEIEEAEKLGLSRWVAESRDVLVRLTPIKVTGRRFRFDVPQDARIE